MEAFDLQIHSHFSPDSFQSPKKILKRARAANLDGIAITDHDSFAGSRSLLELSPPDITVVPGMEISTEHGDVLALGIKHSIESNRFHVVADEVANHGGVLVLAHPYRKQRDYSKDVLERVDAIEGFNARSKSKTNEQARQLGNEKSLAMTGASDAHLPFEVGAGRTTFERPVRDSADICNAIREGEMNPKGTESPYYLTHGLSVTIELLKNVVGSQR